jgi:hypothetical protein
MLRRQNNPPEKTARLKVNNPGHGPGFDATQGMMSAAMGQLE